METNYDPNFFFLKRTIIFTIYVIVLRSSNNPRAISKTASLDLVPFSSFLPPPHIHKVAQNFLSGSLQISCVLWSVRYIPSFFFCSLTKMSLKVSKSLKVKCNLSFSFYSTRQQLFHFYSFSYFPSFFLSLFFCVYKSR